MSGLPAGWQGAKIGDVCRVAGGGTPKTGDPSLWGGDVPWITPADMSRDRSQVLSHGARFLSKKGLASCPARLVPEGAVLISSRAPVGYVAIAGKELATNQGCKTAIPPDYIDSRYLYWYLIHARPDLEARASGTTFKELSAKEFANTRIAWPSLREQRRIVDILEDHLSRLDAANASLAAARRRATALEEGIVDEAVRSAEGERVPLASLLREKMRNGFSARAATQGAIRIVTLTAVTKRCFTEEYTKLTDAPAERVRGLWLEPGDVFVQRANTPELVGSSAIYRGSCSGTC